jgi:hypothetical protein
MSVSEELRKHKDQAPPAPGREESKAVKDTLEGQLGYRLGWHHAMDDAIEIAEDEEEL